MWCTFLLLASHTLLRTLYLERTTKRTKLLVSVSLLAWRKQYRGLPHLSKLLDWSTGTIGYGPPFQALLRQDSLLSGIFFTVYNMGYLKLGDDYL
jgi:hypothetical protein